MEKTLQDIFPEVINRSANSKNSKNDATVILDKADDTAGGKEDNCTAKGMQDSSSNQETRHSTGKECKEQNV